MRHHDPRTNKQLFEFSAYWRDLNLKMKTKTFLEYIKELDIDKLREAVIDKFIRQNKGG